MPITDFSSLTSARMDITMTPASSRHRRLVSTWLKINAICHRQPIFLAPPSIAFHISLLLMTFSHSNRIWWNHFRARTVNYQSNKGFSMVVSPLLDDALKTHLELRQTNGALYERPSLLIAQMLVGISEQFAVCIISAEPKWTLPIALTMLTTMVNW